MEKCGSFFRVFGTIEKYDLKSIFCIKIVDKILKICYYLK